MSLIGSNNEEKIWNYLKSKGFTDCGIAGLMGNLKAESGLNSKNLQNTSNNKLCMTDEEYTNAVDNGRYSNFVKDSAGYGLAQWTYWSRKQNLLNFAHSKNKSIGDLEMQLDFLYKELSENYKSVFNTLKSATTVLEASNSVLLKFEKPANQSESVQRKRAEYSHIYYDKYVKKETIKDNKEEECTMAVIIGSARVDERGKYSGGQAGSQIAKEISKQDWYLHAKGWIVIRPKDPNKAEKIAKNMEYACDSKYVGYDQSQNTTLYHAVKSLDFDISKLKTMCETDCARLVRVCVKYAGINADDFYTGTEVNVLKKTGEFEILTSDKYCKSSQYLKRGDILVTKSKGHTVVVLSNGSKVSSNTTTTTTTTTNSGYNKTSKWIGVVTASSLNVRSGAGTSYSKCSFSPLKKDAKVEVCDSTKASDGSTWYYIKYNGKYGFVHSSYVKKEEVIKYNTTANLNLRSAAGVINKNNVLCVIPKGSTVTYKNKYSTVNGVKWYYVTYNGKTGYASGIYLKKV